MPERPPPAAAPSERRARARQGDVASASMRDFWSLAKPEISFLVTISALAGFLLGAAETGVFSGSQLVFTLAGVFLCAGGVGALNHYLERHLDAQMKRTRDRALPAGRVSPKTARRYGLALASAGVGLLCPLVGPLTAALAILTGVLYLYVYTPLKQKTSHNTLVGTIPGALPALGGYAAATGSLSVTGWLLFGVMATWQMPHFLSLAWMYRTDYERAGFRMTPTVQADGGASTARQTIAYTTLLLALSTLLSLAGPLGMIYLTGAVPLGGWFLCEGIRFNRRRTNQSAGRVLKASIWYVPALVVLIAVDWLV